MKTAIRILGAILVIKSVVSPDFRLVVTLLFAAIVVFFNIHYTLKAHTSLTGKRVGFMMITFGAILAGANVLFTGICPLYLFLCMCGLAVYITEKLNIIDI